MKCQKYQSEILDGLKFCEECVADGWVKKYDEKLAGM